MIHQPLSSSELLVSAQFHDDHEYNDNDGFSNHQQHRQQQQHEGCSPQHDDGEQVAGAGLQHRQQERQPRQMSRSSSSSLDTTSSSTSSSSLLLGALSWNDLPFVGRTKELEKLEDIYETTFGEARTPNKNRRFHAVWIHGPSGCGKSSLVQHFVQNQRRKRRRSTATGGGNDFCYCSGKFDQYRNVVGGGNGDATHSVVMNALNQLCSQQDLMTKRTVSSGAGRDTTNVTVLDRLKQCREAWWMVARRRHHG